VRGLLLSLCCCITLLPINASADQKWDENLRWRHLFSLATEEQLGSANDVQQIQRSVMEASGTPDPRLGSIRWISRSVVGVRAIFGQKGSVAAAFSILSRSGGSNGRWCTRSASRRPTSIDLTRRCSRRLADALRRMKD